MWCSFQKSRLFSDFLPDSKDSLNEMVSQEPQWGCLEVLGQCNLTYIVTQSRKSLILVDQHAGHERVAFERLMASWKKKQFDVQKHLQPPTFTLEESLCEHLFKCQSDFQNIGIGLERTGPDTLAISSKPVILSDKSLIHALKTNSTADRGAGG